MRLFENTYDLVILIGILGKEMKGAGAKKQGWEAFLRG